MVGGMEIHTYINLRFKIFICAGTGIQCTQRKPAPVSFCPPRISNDLTRDQTQAVVLRSQQFAAWVGMATLQILKVVAPLTIIHSGIWGS
jgi:hypothetical protein